MLADDIPGEAEEARSWGSGVGVGSDGEVAFAGWGGSGDGAEWVSHAQDVDASHWDGRRRRRRGGEGERESTGSVDGYNVDAVVECDGGEGD